MLYEITLSIPPRTPKNNPVVRSIEFEEDILIWLGVKFPSGCVALVHLAIFYGKLQIWPHKHGEWVKGDNELVGDFIFYKFTEVPYRVEIKGYNEDELYTHKPIVRFMTGDVETKAWMKGILEMKDMIYKVGKRMRVI